MRPSHSGITLSTGRELDAYGEVLGLSAFGDLTLRYGYDGTVNECSNQSDFTVTERTEIADHMITRWRMWATPGSEGR